MFVVSPGLTQRAWELWQFGAFEDSLLELRLWRILAQGSAMVGRSLVLAAASPGLRPTALYSG